jgi:hypothetical protein
MLQKSIADPRFPKLFSHGYIGKLKPLNDTIDLDWVFSLHDTQCVRKDGTIMVKGKEYKVGRHPGQEVTISLIPKLKLMVYKGQEKVGEYHL